MAALLPFSVYAGSSCKEIGPVVPEVHGDLDQAVAGALKQPDATVRQVFRSGTWRILYVTSTQADSAYLFYAASPSLTPPVTMWAGAARHDETAAIERWVQKNAFGIPPDLAKCFAIYVTTHRSM